MYANSEWTNNEASRTKMSLAQMGYIDDKFVKYFSSTPLKRTPEINRGYYARVHSISHIVNKFCMAEGASAQIINIGSGFDTLYWRLITSPKISFSKYVDVDTKEVIDYKIRAIQNNQQLRENCKNIQPMKSSIFKSDQYIALAQDATKPLQLIEKLVKFGEISKSNPTLFVFECVLLYWDEEAATNLIHLLNKSFEDCSFVVFDLVNTDDKFSHVMQESLNDNDTPLLGAPSARTLEDWNKKFLSNGCSYVKSWLMTEVFASLIDKIEKKRMEEIEFLDEVELLTQLFNHYCLVIASKKEQFIEW